MSVLSGQRRLRPDHAKLYYQSAFQCQGEFVEPGPPHLGDTAEDIGDRDITAYADESPDEGLLKVLWIGKGGIE